MVKVRSTFLQLLVVDMQNITYIDIERVWVGEAPHCCAWLVGIAQAETEMPGHCSAALRLWPLTF
jgi:hypothetical protein